MSDLVVPAGQTRVLAATELAGWVEVHGALVIDGDLVCLGISVEPGGCVRCEQLVTNVLEVDSLAAPATVEAAAVRARLVSLIQVTGGALATRMEAGPWEVDYTHHYAGDLNPSFDYERGDRIVGRAYLEGDDLPLQIDIAGIRRALCGGANPFTMPPIVTVEAVAKVEAAPEDPLAIELAAFVDQHPGPQRLLFDQLRSAWTPRLTGSGAAIARVLKKAVGSPKLAAQRDAWIAELVLVDAAKSAPEPVQRVAVHLDPPKRIHAWLDQIPRTSDRIDAVDQRITAIPPQIARYTRVTHVQLSYNKIERLPLELWTLPIEHLDLRGNKLVEIPEDIAGLRALSMLVLEDNPIAVLPDALCDLPLTQLSLQGTAIARLPERFGQLQALTYLSLQGCQKLAELPESFFALSALQTLNLHYTRLRPAVLARLRTTFAPAVFGNFFG